MFNENEPNLIDIIVTDINTVALIKVEVTLGVLLFLFETLFKGQFILTF